MVPGRKPQPQTPPSAGTRVRRRLARPSGAAKMGAEFGTRFLKRARRRAAHTTMIIKSAWTGVKEQHNLSFINSSNWHGMNPQISLSTFAGKIAALPAIIKHFFNAAHRDPRTRSTLFS